MSGHTQHGFISFIDCCSAGRYKRIELLARAYALTRDACLPLELNSEKKMAMDDSRERTEVKTFQFTLKSGHTMKRSRDVRWCAWQHPRRMEIQRGLQYEWIRLGASLARARGSPAGLTTA